MSTNKLSIYVYLIFVWSRPSNTFIFVKKRINNYRVKICACVYIVYCVLCTHVSEHQSSNK